MQRIELLVTERERLRSHLRGSLAR
jgi:hypothetical protein